jgi:uncharacterized membrane protein
MAQNKYLNTLNSYYAELLSMEKAQRLRNYSRHDRSNRTGKNAIHIVTCMSDYRRGFGLVIKFTELL